MLNLILSCKMGQTTYSEPISFEDMEQKEEETTKTVESTEPEKKEQE
jgi:hypothetical protein